MTARHGTRALFFRNNYARIGSPVIALRVLPVMSGALRLYITLSLNLAFPSNIIAEVPREGFAMNSGTWRRWAADVFREVSYPFANPLVAGAILAIMAAKWILWLKCVRTKEAVQLLRLSWLPQGFSPDE